MGNLIVCERITDLGESPRTFPKARIYELLNSLEQDIATSDMRWEFQKKIANAIRTTEIA